MAETHVQSLIRCRCLTRYRTARPVTQAFWATSLAVPLVFFLLIEGYVGFVGFEFLTTIQHSVAGAVGYVVFGAAGPVAVLSTILWRPRSRVGVAQRIIRGEVAGFVVVATIAMMIILLFLWAFAHGNGPV